MQTLIDKVKVPAENSNIPTVGFKTLLVVLKNGAGSASSFAGTKDEADKIITDGLKVNVSENSDGTNARGLDPQYVKVRTCYGTLNALLEIVLTDAYISSIKLPTDYTIVQALLTQPSNSEV